MEILLLSCLRLCQLATISQQTHCCNYLMTAVGQVSVSGKLLVFVSIVILGFRPRWTYDHIFMSHNSGTCATTSFLTKSQSSPTNCCWSSPAQWFLVLDLVGTHDHISVLSRPLRVLKWGLFFDEGRALTTTGHSFSGQVASMVSL
jgi:hypothetical protein